MGFGFGFGKKLRLEGPKPKELKEPKINIHDANSILFFDEYLPYYEFTNFYQGAPIKINDTSFNTTEHYYQWQKFTDPIIRSRIINAPTARMATDIAEKNKHLIIPNFDKKNAMLIALREKFSQYQILGNVLTSTGNRTLIEHNMNDDYWSDGGDGSGLNMLGVLLMQVREELNNGTLKYVP